MTMSSIVLQERQVVNIADGKCLGTIKDIELNLWTGDIAYLVLPSLQGFWHRLPHAGELRIPWKNVTCIGVDVVLIHMPELMESESFLGKGKRKKQQQKNSTDAIWQHEVAEYQKDLEGQNIIVLSPEDYREI